MSQQRLLHDARLRAGGLALTVLLHVAILAVLLTPRTRLPLAASAARERTPAVIYLASAERTPPAALSRPAAAAPADRRASARIRPPKPPAPASVRPVAHSDRRPPEPPNPAPSSAPTPQPALALAAADSAASVAAAPPPARSAATPPPIEYLRRISRIIELSQQYPWSARQRGEQGDVIVRMHLHRNGTVQIVTLLRSSGVPALDNEACDVVWRIGRFPPFPADYRPHIAEFDIDQPISFRHYRL